MTFIDVKSKRTVSIVRKTDGTQDSNTGLFSASVTTVQSGIVCDIQPLLRNKAKTIFDSTGKEVHANFVCFTVTKISTSFRESDLIIDSGDLKEYEIRGFSDWRSHWEIMIQLITRE